MINKPQAKGNSLAEKTEFNDLVRKCNFFKDLMANIPDVIYFKDKSGRLVMVNNAYARGLGCKPEDIVGKTDFDIFPRQRAEKMSKDDRLVILTGKSIIDKVERATRPDGIDNYVSTTKIPRYDTRGRIIGLVGITRDITRRIHMERLIEEKAKIEKRMEALEEINKLKSQFVTTVSHELRTPLTIVKEAISLISDGVAGSLNDRQKSIIKNAHLNVDRLKHIVGDLLDISRLERGAFKMQYSFFNLCDLIRDNSEFFIKMAQTKNIRLDYDLGVSSIYLFADPVRINQIMSNLINNALKFTEEGGIVKVEVKLLESKVRVGVYDTGIGITKADLPRLFNKFVQLKKAESAERKGLGLGLFITRELVEKQGGEIWADSQIGMGSKFYFTLPRFYTPEILEKSLRDNLNDLLAKGVVLYLVNLSVVNFSEFKKRLKNKLLKRIFDDIRLILESELRKLYGKKSDLAAVIADIKNGSFDLFLSTASEQKTDKFCRLLKAKINKYFIHNKTADFFINPEISDSRLKIEPNKAAQSEANVNIKKIYIGANMRRFKRAAYKADILITPDNGKQELSQSIDISKGGISFISNLRFKTDSEINLSLKLGGSQGQLNLNGIVAWIRNIKAPFMKETDTYKVGVEFSPLKANEKKVISKFVDSLLTKA